jgi:peptide/nickel transport system ATP-binding protein
MMITHDLGVVAGLAGRVQVMYGGTVVESGPVDEVFAAPRMPYTLGLLGSVPHPEVVGRPLTPVPGAPPSLLRLPRACTFAPRCPLVAEVCQEAEPELLDTDRPGHPARCHRWPVVAGIARPQELFARREIGHPDIEVELVDAAAGAEDDQ